MSFWKKDSEKDSGLGFGRYLGPSSKSASVTVLSGSGDLLYLDFFMSGMEMPNTMETFEASGAQDGQKAG